MPLDPKAATENGSNDVGGGAKGNLHRCFKCVN